MPPITILAHDIRSAHNVGSILRTADGFGAEQVICSGYTPYPRLADDQRLGYLIERLTFKIAKTALGAELTVPCSHTDSIHDVITDLKARGYRIVGLEQDARSVPLPSYQAIGPTALLLGEERHGITADLLALCDDIVEIPMFGQKHSFNVSVSTGVAMYQLRIQAS